MKDISLDNWWFPDGSESSRVTIQPTSGVGKKNGKWLRKCHVGPSASKFIVLRKLVSKLLHFRVRLEKCSVETGLTTLPFIHSLTFLTVY